MFGLGFGGCKLQVQVPETSTKSRSAHDLVGGRIATSFKELTKQYFRRLERQQTDGHQSAWKDTMRTRVDHLSGSVETACTISGVDGIVDLVESGETMRAAGLKAIDTVCTSTAVLIKSKHPRNKQLMDMVARRIEGVIGECPWQSFSNIMGVNRLSSFHHKEIPFQSSSHPDNAQLILHHSRTSLLPHPLQRPPPPPPPRKAHHPR